MLPPLVELRTGDVVDEDDLTREVSTIKIDNLLSSFRKRGRRAEPAAAAPTGEGGAGDGADDDGEMRKSWRGMVDKLTALREGGAARDGSNDDVHAELLILTTETDEKRASSLLDLGEKALLHVLGGVSVARVDVNVVTAQKETSAKLNLFERGTRLAAMAYGIGGTPLREVEDFLSTRAASEFEMMLLRFYDTDVIENPRLTMHLRYTNRTLEVQRPDTSRRHARARAAVSAD